MNNEELKLSNYKVIVVFSSEDQTYAQWSILEEGKGEILTTNLWNYALPFIRYTVKDSIIATDKNYFNKDGAFSATKILGRDVDILTTPAGKKLIVHFFTGFFAGIKEIKQYQLAHTSFDKMELRLI